MCVFAFLHSRLRSSQFLCGPSALCPLEMEAVAPPAVVVVEDAPEEDQKQVPEVQVVAADLQQQELQQQQQQQPEQVFEENNVQGQGLHQVQVVEEQDGGLEVQERPEGVVAADAALSQEEEEKQQQEEQQKDGGGIAVSQKRDRDEQEKEVDKKWAGWPGDNVFRLVVPVQKVGGIIGRKGEFVKKMCEDTRSRIKILEGVPGTPERIV